jgi:phosphohistidine phosphatase
VHLERLREKFPTAALATLTFQGSWGQLTPGGAELVAFVKPRELEDS